MKTTLLLISLLSPLLAQAATPTEEVTKVASAEQTCLNVATSNTDMKSCVYTAYQDADKILNTMYKASVSNLNTATDSDSKEVLRRLLSSERAWVNFRDANCDLAGVDMLGGTGESLSISSCLADTTIARVKELDQLLNPSN